MYKRILVVLCLFFLIGANDDCAPPPENVEQHKNFKQGMKKNNNKKEHSKLPHKFIQINTLVENKLYSILLISRKNQPVNNPSRLFNQGLKELGEKFDIQDISVISNGNGKTTTLTVIVKPKKEIVFDKEILAEAENFEVLETKKKEKPKNYKLVTLIPDKCYAVLVEKKLGNPVAILNQGSADLCQERNCQSVTAITDSKGKTISLIILVE